MDVLERMDKVLIVELDSEGDSRKVATIMKDGKWRVNVYGKDVSNNERLSPLQSILTVDTFSSFIDTLISVHVCSGNQDFTDLTEEEISARPIYQHPSLHDFATTIHHNECPILVQDAGRCAVCRIYRSDLAAVRTRTSRKQDTAQTSRNKPHKFMTKPELKERLQSVTQENKKGKRQLATAKNFFETNDPAGWTRTPQESTQSFPKNCQ